MKLEIEVGNSRNWSSGLKSFIWSWKDPIEGEKRTFYDKKSSTSVSKHLWTVFGIRLFYSRNHRIIWINNYILKGVFLPIDKIKPFHLHILHILTRDPRNTKKSSTGRYRSMQILMISDQTRIKENLGPVGPWTWRSVEAMISIFLLIEPLW